MDQIDRDTLRKVGAGLPTCSRCGDPLLFSARQRGAGLCGPCSRLGPATSADLLELDAVPEPVDSDQPSDIHARTLARART